MNEMEKYASDINDGMSKEFLASVQKEWFLNDREKRAFDSKRYSTAKVIVSGHIIEVYSYEIPVQFGKKSCKKEQLAYHESTHDVDPETGEIRRKDYSYDPESARQANCRRAKNNLRRLLISNFDNRSTFITLTFRNGSVQDVTDVKECNIAFRQFIKRMRRRYGGFKYCTVIEFQDTNGRGAVHYHVVADIPYVHYEKLAEIWENGFIGINRIDHVDNVGAYITKYMTKDSNDPRLQGKKSYMTSTNMIRPIEVFGGEAHEIVEKYLMGKKRVFTNSYESEHQGKITYEEYNLKRD